MLFSGRKKEEKKPPIDSKEAKGEFHIIKAEHIQCLPVKDQPFFLKLF